MTLAAAQERYDNMQPPESEPEHSFTGDVVIDDTLFKFEDGYIIEVSTDEDGTMIPYDQWTGSEELVAKADEEAQASWLSSQEERSYYDH
jgi:hypothetical protein